MDVLGAFQHSRARGRTFAVAPPNGQVPLVFVSANSTPFLAEGFTSIDSKCLKSFVLVLRATYEVDADGNCHPSAMQSPFVYADRPYGDPATTAIRVESDFVPLKPRAEVLLDGHAMSPSGAAVESVEVALLGSSLNKRAIVTGERHWQRGAFGMRASRPQPFETLPLAWHLAYGGTDRNFDDPADIRSDARNPVGRGFQVNSRTEAIDGQPLPCIEHPGSRMKRWNDRPEPIGFGPVPRFATSRARYAGTYDQHWMDEVLPFLPEDFDTRYFQAAPPDQQFEALSEGMAFACVHMNHTGLFRVRLPRLSVPVSFHFDDRIRVPTVTPDTLILRPHEHQIVLLGRARAPLPRKFTRLREVTVGVQPTQVAA